MNINKMPLSEEEKIERKKLYEKKKELKRIRNRNYYQNNKEYFKSEKVVKQRRIARWKKYGIICNNYDEMYNIYINTSKCDYCNKDFENSKERCLDHNHETGEVRGILCRDCNWKDVLKD
jgi:hypothetical protein